MKLLSITSALALAAMASTAQAQTVIHYWDFSSMDDSVGGLVGSAVGTPDLSVHATYGEAYTGSGPTLNTVLGGTGSGGGFVSADVHDGTNPTAMDFGTGDWSFSYWVYDNTSDGDSRGPRVFDCLSGTSIGIQLASNTTPLFNFRIDDHEGAATISNNYLVVYHGIDTWVHVAGTVDRANNQAEIWFDGVSQGTYALTGTLTGQVFPSHDLQIGVINGGGDPAAAQESGLDDLAFYDGLLSAADIAGLASGTLTPPDFGPEPGTGYCFADGSGTQCPCGNNSDGTVPGSGCANGASAAGAKLTASGDASLSNDTLVLSATGLDPNNSGLYFQANNDLSPGNIWGDGLQCAGGQLKRLGVRFSSATGDSDTSAWATPISVKAGNVLAGDTKRYQLWYRDNSGGQPCGVGVNDFNATNGYEITWTP